MKMLFLLQFILIFHGALCTEENVEDSAKNETAAGTGGTDSLESRSDAFKPSYLYDYETKNDEPPEPKPTETFQDRDWSNQYKFQDSDSVDFNFDQTKETTATPYKTYQESSQWSKSFNYDESSPTKNEYYNKQFNYDESAPTKNEYYNKPFSYDESSPTYNKPFSYDESSPTYNKPFSYEDSKPSTNDDDPYYQYESSKPLTNEQYYDKPLSYEGDEVEGSKTLGNQDYYEEGKPLSNQDYYEKPFSYEESKPAASYQAYDNPSSYQESKPGSYDKPFSYRESKPHASYEYDESKPLSNEEYYDKKPFADSQYYKPFSFGSTSSKLLEFNEKIPAIKPFVMENSPRDYIPLKMIEDYSQMGGGGSHVSIPPFKSMKSGKNEHFGKKQMYEPIVLGDYNTKQKVLDAAKSSIQTLQQSIKENMPFALPYTFNQDDDKEKGDGKGNEYEHRNEYEHGKGNGNEYEPGKGNENEYEHGKASGNQYELGNGYYFKFEDKRPTSPKLQSSYNFKLKEDLPLVRPTDVYHGPRYPIHPSSEVLNQDDEKFNPTPYKFTHPKVQYQSVYHKPLVEHHVKPAKQIRKKVKKRPVVYWDDDKKHLLNLIPTPFEEPKKPMALQVKKPPKGPYIQRIPDPHNRMKDQYILPDSTTNIGPHGQQQQNSAEPSFFENLTSMLFGEYPSNNVIYVPKPKRMRGPPGKPHPGYKRAQPRSSEGRRSGYRARSHVDFFNFE